jgi:hypothetical protein
MSPNCDDRNVDYKAFGVRWWIVDNFFNAGAVLARPSTTGALDRTHVEGSTPINSKSIGKGLVGFPSQ